MRRVISIVCCFWLLTTAAFGAISTQGTDFWVTFLRNLRAGEYSLLASSPTGATVTVTNPRTHWSSSFTVPAGQTTTYALPRAQCYSTSDGIVESKGLHITSTSPIALYASNYADGTYDATLVLPAHALGLNYIIQTYEDKQETAEFAVVGTLDNTSVTITPHARTRDGHVKNVAYTVTLQAGESYQVFCDDQGGDFSGTHIRADKPIAVFAGHACASVPISNHWCDHLVEQQMPTSRWGRQFAITKTAGQAGNQVMVTAKENNTVVQLNGSPVAVLQALQTYSFRLTDNSAFVQTSEPAACYLYVEGAKTNKLYGDPSSVAIQPMEQNTKDITFATFQTNGSNSHFVNIVASSSDAASIRLDGVSIADAFAPVEGNSSLIFAQIPVLHGTHSLHSTGYGFVGYIYGMGHCESYAYSLGSSIYTLEREPEDGGWEFYYLDLTYTDVQCYKKAIDFTGYFDLDYTSASWDFGDGSTAQGMTASHTYAAPGAYTVTFTVTSSDYPRSVTKTLLVSDMYRDTIHAEICADETYTVEGHTYSKTGHYVIKQTASGECDSLVILDLVVHPKYHTIERDSFPQGGFYRWHDERLRSSGHYIDTLPSIHGCDSITELYLTVTDPTEEMYDTICWQPTYRFRSHDYPLPPKDGYEDRDFILYTLSYNNKYTCTSYRMHLAIVPSEGGEYTVYDTIHTGQSYTWFGDAYSTEGTYHKSLGDKNCMQEYTLHLTVLPFPVQFIDTSLCHEDTIWWNEHPYTQAGIYTDTLFSQVGIEGIYQLTIRDRRSFSSLTVQNVPSYDFHGRVLTESSTYRDTLINAEGCDSVVTLYLGIMEPCTIRTEEWSSLCENEIIVWNGQNCIPGNDYTATFTSVDGCDSIVTLHLTALERKQTELSVGLCEGDYYRVGEERLTTPGSYMYSLTSSEGCDSILTLQLYRQPNFSDTLDTYTRVNEPYHWQATDYSEAGTYTVGLIASNGCDSIKVLRLEVLPACPEDDTEDVFDTIIAGQSYPFENELYSQTGVYTHTLTGLYRCDSIRVLHLEVNSLQFTSVESSDLCAHNGWLSIYLDYTGIVHQVRLRFDAHSLQAGWCDTVMTMPEDGVIRIPVSARAGQYQVTIELVFRDQVIDSYTMPIRLLYPSSVLEQAWDDVIAVLTHDYNGGYDFTAYQWYKDGVALTGENRSYLYQPLVMGAEYSALLTEQDGTQMMTCPLIARPQQELSLYPTITEPRNPIRCYVPDEGTMRMFDVSGHPVGGLSLHRGENILEAPAAQGIYILRIRINGAERNQPYKLIVQ